MANMQCLQTYLDSSFFSSAFVDRARKLITSLVAILIDFLVPKMKRISSFFWGTLLIPNQSPAPDKNDKSAKLSSIFFRFDSGISINSKFVCTPIGFVLSGMNIEYFG